MILPTLVACALVLLVLTLPAQSVPAFRDAVADLGSREPAIDGLRGLCALAVAAHHLVYVLV